MKDNNNDYELMFHAIGPDDSINGDGIDLLEYTPEQKHVVRVLDKYITQEAIDTVCIDTNTRNKLVEMTTKTIGDDCVGLPDSIFARNTIPIKDMKIVEDASVSSLKAINNFKESKAIDADSKLVTEMTKVASKIKYVTRVIIFEPAEVHQIEPYNIIGALVTWYDDDSKVKEIKYVFPIQQRRNGYVFLSDSGFVYHCKTLLSIARTLLSKNYSNELLDESMMDIDVTPLVTAKDIMKDSSSPIVRIATSALFEWYAIQVSLLNPLIKYEEKTETVVEHRKSRSGKKKPPKIKYYRKIYIKPENIDEFFEETKDEKGQIHRKCLMWYVTGHWRRYKNGKRTFINGYWKGEGRFSGIEVQTRQRELVLSEEDLKKERIVKPKEPARRLLVNPEFYENVHCECGEYNGEDMLGEVCPKCGKIVMYRG